MGSTIKEKETHLSKGIKMEHKVTDFQLSRLKLYFFLEMVLIPIGSFIFTCDSIWGFGFVFFLVAYLVGASFFTVLNNVETETPTVCYH